MIIGQRITERMQLAQLTQAELARRIGMSQQAVGKLVHGGSRSSPNLHKIARVLGTTATYLSGETDDPETECPAPPSLSSAEQQILDLFRFLQNDQRKLLLGVARAMVGQQVSIEPVSLPSTAALEDALSGFLEASPGLSGDELVHELAMSLPIILRAASDEIREDQSGEHESEISRQSVGGGGHRAAQQGRRI